MIKRLISLFLAFVLTFGASAFLSGCGYNYSRKIIKAIEDDDHETFVQLLEKKKNVDSKPYLNGMDIVNLPPLHYACKVGKYEYVKKLVESGANINNVDHDLKTTPLMVALDSSNENRFEIAKYLIDRGADINIEAHGSTALECVFSYNSENYSQSKEKAEYDFAKFMIDKGAVIACGGLGHIVFYAAQKNNKMTVEYLVETKNTDINLKDDIYEYTALMWAVKFDSYNVAKYLIDSGADLNIVNKEGKVAKDIAIYNDNFKILELFNN